MTEFLEKSGAEGSPEAAEQARIIEKHFMELFAAKRGMTEEEVRRRFEEFVQEKVSRGKGPVTIGQQIIQLTGDRAADLERVRQIAFQEQIMKELYSVTPQTTPEASGAGGSLEGQRKLIDSIDKLIEAANSMKLAAQTLQEFKQTQGSKR